MCTVHLYTDKGLYNTQPAMMTLHTHTHTHTYKSIIDTNTTHYVYSIHTNHTQTHTKHTYTQTDTTQVYAAYTDTHKTHIHTDRLNTGVRSIHRHRPFKEAFLRTFIAYSLPLSFPPIFLTRNTCTAKQGEGEGEGESEEREGEGSEGGEGGGCGKMHNHGNRNADTLIRRTADELLCRVHFN